MGIQETSKLHPMKEFRSILEGKHRIIYEVNAQELIIHFVFDTRQNRSGLTF